MAPLAAYRIFSDPSGDWYIAARRDGDDVAVLYEGHHRSDAIFAILRDLGVEVPTFETIEREMDECDGTYYPVSEDWK